MASYGCHRAGKLVLISDSDIQDMEAAAPKQLSHSPGQKAATLCSAVSQVPSSSII